MEIQSLCISFFCFAIFIIYIGCFIGNASRRYFNVIFKKVKKLSLHEQEDRKQLENILDKMTDSQLIGIYFMLSGLVILIVECCIIPLLLNWIGIFIIPLGLSIKMEEYDENHSR